jgi:hypothetical protein
VKVAVVGLILRTIMTAVAYGRAELLATGRQVGLVVTLTIAEICVCQTSQGARAGSQARRDERWRPFA